MNTMKLICRNGCQVVKTLLRVMGILDMPNWNMALNAIGLTILLVKNLGYFFI